APEIPAAVSSSSRAGAGLLSASAAPHRAAAVSGRKDVRREVAITAIADDDHDQGIVHLMRKLQRCGDGTAGAYAGEDSFPRAQCPGGFLRLGLAHIDDAVDPGRIID